MNKKQQLNQDRKLLQQLYSRLNIIWQQKSSPDDSNPILHRAQNNLMSKSIAHKFYSSKRYKLNQNKPTQKKESNHIFTNNGIIKAPYHQRRMSEPSIVPKKQNKTINYKFEKYQNSQLNKISTQRKSIKTVPNENEDLSFVNYQNKNIKKREKSLRAMSAHFSSRRTKTSHNECFSFRKTCENWGLNHKIQRQKDDIKGWDIQIDNLDINLIQLKVCNQN